VNEGGEYDVVDPALAARLGDGVRVIKQNVGVFDTMPLSLITTRTVEGLERLTGRALEPERFRPNLLVQAASEDAFPEEAWIGCVVRVGGMRMRIDVRDQRCVIVNMDPHTGERDPSVLRAIAQRRRGAAGVYGSTVTPGRVAVGDAVVLER
jgi:uncharacterized protein YcbX